MFLISVSLTFRDDPDDLPVFLISNNSKESCVLKVEADNIFAAIG